MMLLVRAKIKKIFSKIKWTYREYHVQGNDYVAHRDVKIYCNTKQIPESPFCGPYSKPHGTRGLSKHYHFCFDQKIGNGVCAIFRILCACVAFTTMLDKPWIYDIP